MVLGLSLRYTMVDLDFKPPGSRIYLPPNATNHLMEASMWMNDIQHTKGKINAMTDAISRPSTAYSRKKSAKKNRGVVFVSLCNLSASLEGRKAVGPLDSRISDQETRLVIVTKNRTNRPNRVPIWALRTFTLCLGDSKWPPEGPRLWP